MLRSLLGSLSNVGKSLHFHPNHPAGPQLQTYLPQFSRCFSAITCHPFTVVPNENCDKSHSAVWRSPSSVFTAKVLSPVINKQQSRNVVKYGWDGNRKSIKAVTARFKRLDWGIWIRRMAGAHKKLWKKTNRRRMKLERHVFCNARQSYLLDKMVAHHFRKPKYWVDDPYAPYHQREDFYATRQNPRPLPLHVSFKES